MSSVWSWNDRPGGWVEVQPGGTQDDVERKYATARNHGLTGAAFVLMPTGKIPEGNPERIGAPIVREEPGAAKRQRQLDDIAAGVATMYRRLGELRKQIEEVDPEAYAHPDIVGVALDQVHVHLGILEGHTRIAGGRA